MTFALAGWIVMLLAAQASPDAPLPRYLALEEPRTRAVQEPSQERFPRSEPARPAQAERPFVDFDWLEVTPSVGVASYSSAFLAGPSLAVSVRAHVPMPWLSPSGRVVQESFGLFFEASFMGIERDLSPTVSHRSGLASSYCLGVDYAIVRDGTWLLVARAGLAYVYYGGIHDLKSGLGPLVGLSAGVQISRSMAITYNPELVFGGSGSWILLNTVGVDIQF
jgi:hypothetical protein